MLDVITADNQRLLFNGDLPIIAHEKMSAYAYRLYSMAMGKLLVTS